MKKSYIVSRNILLLFIVFALGACFSKKNEVTAKHQHETKQEYTCPMHPQIISDKPGKCPICGMDLVPKEAVSRETVVDSSLADLLKPVNEQVVARTPTIEPDNNIRILSVPVQGSITYDTRNQTSISSRVSGRIERLLIKYNYQPVQKGQLIMEIYSPDLAAAQQELLFIYQQDRNNTDLLQKARQRLLLLGMQQAQINQVLRSGKILYRVPVYSNASGYILERPAGNANPPASASMSAASSGGDGMNGMGGGSTGAASSPSPASETTTTTTPVLIREGQYVGAGQTVFTIYRSNSVVAEFAFDPRLSPFIKTGQKLVFFKTADPATVYTGTIGLIQPTFNAGGKFIIARVYLNDSRFQIGQLLTARVPVLDKGWWLPQSAVLSLGNQSVVFKKNGNVFVPKAVKAKLSAEGMVLIEDSIGGWQVAKNAAYLIDSESFIKLSSYQTQPEK